MPLSTTVLWKYHAFSINTPWKAFHSPWKLSLKLQSEISWSYLWPWIFREKWSILFHEPWISKGETFVSHEFSCLSFLWTLAFVLHVSLGRLQYWNLCSLLFAKSVWCVALVCPHCVAKAIWFLVWSWIWTHDLPPSSTELLLTEATGPWRNQW